VTNTVSALDARSGRLVGVVPVPAYGTNASLAVDPRTQRVFVLTIAFPAEYVSVFDARTLHLVGRATVSPPSALNTGWAGGGSPLVVDTRTNRVVVSHLASNSLGVLDAQDGHLLHTVTLRPADNVSNGTVQVNAPFLDERLGRVYLIDAAHDVVHTLDATSGRPLGHVVVGAFAFGLPRAVVDERTRRLFVLTRSGVSVLNALSGQLLHAVTMTQTPVMGWGPSMVDEQSGRNFLSTGRSVSILDGLSGRLLHTVAVGAGALGGSPLAVDERTGHLFVASMGPVDKTGLPTGRGVVRVLDGQSGALLHTVPVGAGPLMVVVDERARRMLVFSSGQTSRVRATAGSVTVIDLSRL
jgi:hypothetical protein